MRRSAGADEVRALRARIEELERTQARLRDELARARHEAEPPDPAVARHGGGSSQEARRRRGEHLALALEGAGLGPWIWDLERQRFEFSAQLQEMLGIAPGSFDGSWEMAEALIHPDDREVVAEALRLAIEEEAQENRYRAEFRVTRPEAEGLWFAGVGRVVRDAAGSPRRVVGVVFDVTPQKRVERSLAESEAHLRRAQRIAQLGSFDVDLRGGEDRASDQVYEILCVERGDPRALRRILDEMIVPEDRAAVREAVRRSFAAGSPLEVECRLRRADGALRWIQSVAEVVGEPGAPRRLVGTLVDVTERRELEQRLLRAQKLEAVGRLAGGVAHDFNNLLTVMSGCCELLEGSFAPGTDGAETLRELRAAVEQGGRLTHQLLAFGRRSLLVPVQLDLNALLRELEGLLRRLLPADVELRVSLQPELGHVRADPSQLEQVVMNLVLNARDAMPEGGRLTVATSRTRVGEACRHREQELPPGRWVTLSISDSGLGMDEQTLSQAFEPFFTTKERGKGTGLGLATVFGVVRQSGGHIEVASRPGEGATFRVHLPELSGDAAASPPAGTAGGDGRPGAELAGDETVLLCEDGEALRRLLAAALRARGYRVLEAAHGAEALAAAEDHRGPVDLLVTDVVMPRMSGPELAARLGRRRPGVRVLFISGYTGDAMGDGDLRGRARRLLPKPFTTTQLARAVREALDA